MKLGAQAKNRHSEPLVLKQSVQQDTPRQHETPVSTHTIFDHLKIEWDHTQGAMFLLLFVVTNITKLKLN